jgi:small conductance mechanosensitive channel
MPAEIQTTAEAVVAAQPGGQATADQIIASLTEFAISVVAALAILIVGLWLAKKIKIIFSTLLTAKGVDATLIGFFASMLYGAIVVFVIIASIGKLGVNTTSFAAVIAAAGLAIGLALQGSLSNFASGVLLILFKPFKVGDFIKAGGEAGTIVEVGLLTTELKTPDNVKIIMPNSCIMGGSITNISAHPTRRVDMTVGVSYGDDLNQAKQIMLDLLAADERVLKDPAPQVAVANLGDSSVDFVVRPWVNAADYWAVKFDFTQAVKEKFDAAGVSIPFPQRDVHMLQADA